MSKVFTFITQVQVQILGFEKTIVEVEVSTQAFYSSKKSVKVLVSKLLKVKGEKNAIKDKRLTPKRGTPLPQKTFF